MLQLSLTRLCSPSQRTSNIGRPQSRLQLYRQEIRVSTFRGGTVRPLCDVVQAKAITRLVSKRRQPTAGRGLASQRREVP